MMDEHAALGNNAISARSFFPSRYIERLESLIRSAFFSVDGSVVGRIPLTKILRGSRLARHSREEKESSTRTTNARRVAH